MQKLLYNLLTNYKKLRVMVKQCTKFIERLEIYFIPQLVKV